MFALQQRLGDCIIRASILYMILSVYHTFFVLSTNWYNSAPIWEAQSIVEPKKSSQKHRSSARTDENISNAKVWYRFSGQRKASAILLRIGYELVSKSVGFLMDQAVTHLTSQGTRSNSSLSRLPRSGMWPPP